MLEERRVENGQPVKVTTYTIGHDVLAQFDAINGYLALMADGHGSTRGITNKLGQMMQQYSYDAYGNAVGFDPALAKTNLLYSGEQFNPVSGLQYLRARWYNPQSGTFNRLDPYAGNKMSPLSFHKYAYAHMNPIANTDPSGKLISTLIGILYGTAVRSIGWVIQYRTQISTFTKALNRLTSALFFIDITRVIASTYFLSEAVMNLGLADNGKALASIKTFEDIAMSEFRTAAIIYGITQLPGGSIIETGLSMLGIDKMSERAFNVARAMSNMFNDIIDSLLDSGQVSSIPRLNLVSGDISISMSMRAKFITQSITLTNWLESFYSLLPNKDMDAMAQLYRKINNAMCGVVTFAGH